MSGPAFPDVPLLPCPFCGMAGKWFRTGSYVGVECADGPDCPGRAQTNVYERQHARMAAGCWNTRNDDAADDYATVLETREELLAELQAAHRLLSLALGCMTSAGQAKFARQSEIVGLGTDGATRHHERAAVIAKATGAQP